MDFEQFISKTPISSAVEVIPYLKQIALVVKLDNGSEIREGLYRSESGFRITVDPRIPRPQELYRDIAYHKVDNLLGWDTTLPVVFWEMSETDRGVMRPYIRNAGIFQSYQINMDLFNKDMDYWMKVAVLDYICAVTDRVYNDFLILPSGSIKTMDSGLSFVEGLNFVCQTSCVRNILKGQNIDESILTDLEKLSFENLDANVNGLVNNKLIDFVLQRTDILLVEKRIL